jgi:hypothetical protein
MAPTPKYPDDIVLVASMPPDRLAAFEKWMERLDEEHAKMGSPYGVGTLWETTGASSWVAAFDDGDCPHAALLEDLSCDSW